MATLSLPSLLLAIGGLAFLAGFVLSAVAWIRYRAPDNSWVIVFMSPLFLISPSYFRKEAVTLRRWAIGAFGLAFTCFGILFNELARANP